MLWRAILISASIPFLFFLAPRADAASNPDLELFVVPLECWLGVVDSGTNQAVFLTPDDCVKEPVIKEIDRELNKIAGGNTGIDYIFGAGYLTRTLEPERENKGEKPNELERPGLVSAASPDFVRPDRTTTVVGGAVAATTIATALVLFLRRKIF